MRTPAMRLPALHAPIIRALLPAALLVASSAAAADEGPGIPWSELSKAFSCTPSSVRGDARIQLRKADGTGGELGVVTPRGDYAFLVLADGTADAAGIDAAGFAAARSLSIDTGTLMARLADAEGGGRQRVFQAPGVYTFQLSNVLESDEGGFACRVRYGGPAPGKATR